MIEIPKVSGHSQGLGLAWWFGTTDKGKAVIFRCVNGHTSGLAGWIYTNHAISSNGIVTPSVVCTHPGCTFHEYIKLLDYAHG